MSRSPPWSEVHDGGSAEAERKIFRQMASDMLQAQAVASDRADARHVLRMMYAKTVVGTTNASLAIDRLLPEGLAAAPFRPGSLHPATIRFSNASAVPEADTAPDMRGLSIRFALPDGGIHDMLLANFPTSLARDARQFFAFAMVSIGDRETMLARLAERIGLAEARRIVAYMKASLKLCPSLALEHYWSGCAFLWGGVPARFELRPTAPVRAASAPVRFGNDGLRRELAERLLGGEVGYRLAVQRYVDEGTTPIEDAALDWAQDASPSVEIGTLVISRQDILAAEGERTRVEVDRTMFNPWNAPDEFRPLGSLNRLRRAVFELSALMRGGPAS